MRDAQPEITGAGGHLVVIGSGEPRYARAFREEFAPDMTLLTDPSLEAYRVAGLKRGVARALSPRALGLVGRALKRGLRQGRTRGDAWQLGGAFILTEEGSVPFAQVSERTGDHVEPEAILEALRAL